MPDSSMSDTQNGPQVPAEELERESAEALPVTEAEVVTNRSLARACWLVAMAACLIAAAVLLIRGDNGYAAVAFAVALSAAINLF